MKDLGKEFPGEAEVMAFTSTFIPLLAEAMHLRGRPLPDAEYYDQARPLQQQIVDLVEQPAQHLGVRQVQGIVRDNAHRLYRWVKSRAVPADNNRAERELRPLVIRAQSQLRLPVRGGRPHARGADERAADPAQAQRRWDRRLPTGLGPFG